MDENNQQSPGPVAVTAVTAATAVTVKARPTDVEVFLKLLPEIVGSFALSNTSAISVRDLAINLARETTLRLVEIGICERTTNALDGQQIPRNGVNGGTSVSGSTPTALPVGSGRDSQGSMVAHYENSNVMKIHGL